MCVRACEWKRERDQERERERTIDDNLYTPLQETKSHMKKTRVKQALAPSARPTWTTQQMKNILIICLFIARLIVDNVTSEYAINPLIVILNPLSLNQNMLNPLILIIVRLLSLAALVSDASLFSDDGRNYLFSCPRSFVEYRLHALFGVSRSAVMSWFISSIQRSLRLPLFIFPSNLA